MDEVEKSKKKVLGLLGSIQTADDIKENKDKILDLMEDMFKSAASLLKKFVESLDTMEPEEIEKQAAKFQDEQFLFDSDIENEINRIDEIPGAQELFESFPDLLDERMEPHMEEIQGHMEKLMDKIMGGMLGGLTEAFGDMSGDEEEYEEYEGVPPEPDETRKDMAHLNFIYGLVTIDELKENREWILDSMEEMLKEDLEGLNTMKEMEFPKDQMQETVDKAEMHKTTFINEIIRQFERLGTNEGGEEEAKSAIEELKKRTDKLVSDIEKFNKEFNKN